VGLLRKSETGWQMNRREGALGMLTLRQGVTVGVGLTVSCELWT
jgi:hypothetical protein